MSPGDREDCGNVFATQFLRTLGSTSASATDSCLGVISWIVFLYLKNSIHETTRTGTKISGAASFLGVSLRVNRKDNDRAAPRRQAALNPFFDGDPGTQ